MQVIRDLHYIYKSNFDMQCISWFLRVYVSYMLFL